VQMSCLTLWVSREHHTNGEWTALRVEVVGPKATLAHSEFLSAAILGLVLVFKRLRRGDPWGG
jgi:hypothetical protein